MTMTEGIRSPDLFKRWSAIALLAGALERRVWLKIGPYQTYPNLYTLLVAPPGVGKYIVETVRDLWNSTLQPGSETPAFRVAPDSMTKASLLDTLNKASNKWQPREAPNLKYHSLLIGAEEFSVLLPGYDLEYIGVLNSLFNNKPCYEESRRTGSVRELKIDLPQLNIFGGVQPMWLASTFPEEAWGTGLASRLLMIYCCETPTHDLFYDPGEPEEERKLLLRKLGHLSQMYGQMKWTQEASDAINDWHRAGGPPAPNHSKLAYYCKRRTTIHCPKLALISAVARTGKYVIELVDVRRAIAWLTEAEALMPDIFRAMLGRSDMQVVEELHFYLTRAFAGNKGQPVAGKLIYAFLQQRVPSDKVDKIVDIAQKANIIVRNAGTDLWYPTPKHEHGVE